MRIVCCIANSCLLGALLNVIILDTDLINYIANTRFLCAITVWTATEGDRTGKPSASKELLFARALEHDLLFLVPSRGGTQPLRRAGNTQEKME